MIVKPGVNVPVVRFKDKDLRTCVDGTPGDSFCTQYLENDAAGPLEGSLDPEGGFMIAGTHMLSGMRVVIVGKAKLERSSFAPSKLSGTACYTGPTIRELLSAKFESTRRLP